MYESWAMLKTPTKKINRRWLIHDAFSPVRSITLRELDLARDPALRVTCSRSKWAPGPGEFEHLCAVSAQFWRDSSPMRRISKVANVSHSGPMSPMTLIVCDAKILGPVLSPVISFFVPRNKNQQMRLISKDLGKLVSTKSNVWIPSHDHNTDPKK